MCEPGFLPEIGALAGHLEVAPGDLEIFCRGGGGGAEGVVGVVGVEEVVDDGSGLVVLLFGLVGRCERGSYCKMKARSWIEDFSFFSLRKKGK